LKSVRLQCTGRKNKALLLIHGFSSTPAVYRLLIPQLKHYDSIYCPLLPGHGESIAAFSKIKADAWLDKTQEICASLINEYQQVDVLGLSLGGLLAFELSKQFPIHHLFLLAPALKLHGNTKFMIKCAQILTYLGFTQLRNAAGNLLTLEQAEISYRTIPIIVIKEIVQLITKTQWQTPNCPVDLFLGKADLVVDSMAVEHLFDGLDSVQIHWLMNSAHVLPLDNDFMAITECINQHSAIA